MKTIKSSCFKNEIEAFKHSFTQPEDLNSDTIQLQTIIITLNSVYFSLSISKKAPRLKICIYRNNQLIEKPNVELEIVVLQN